MDRSKIQYLKQNGYIQFDKEEIRKELKAKNIYPLEFIENWVNKYEYYKIMSNGEKMFYSIGYIERYTTKE
jgi:hypothetical protein